MALPPLKVVVTVDDRPLVAGLAKVRARVRKLGADFRRMGRQVSTFVTAPLVALAGVTAKLADTQIRAERTLVAVLKLSGGAAEQRLKSFKDFASALQEITVIGDEVTLKNIQVAKSMGLTDDQAKRAAKNAIALSAAFGISAKSAIRYTAALEEGDTEMLNRYIPTLRNLTDKTERAAEAQRILTGAFDAATEAAKVGLGPIRQMLNDLGDLGEEFGAIVLPALTAFSDKIRGVIDVIRKLEPIQKKWIVGLAAAFAAGGPILIGLGLLAAAIGALLTPVGLVVAAIAGATGLIAAFVGLVGGASDLARATDNVVMALGDEIRQTHQLSVMLGKSNIITLDAAKTKLAEAQARLHNVATMIAEIQILKTMGIEYRALTGRIREEQELLDTLSDRASLSESGRRKVKEIEETLTILNEKLKVLTTVDPSSGLQIQNITKNIGVLMAAISEAKLGLVSFGDAIITPIDTTKRLGSVTDKTTKKLKLEANIFGDLSSAAHEADMRIEGVADQMARAAVEVRDLEGALGALQIILQNVLADTAGSFLSSVFKTGLNALPGLFGSGGAAAGAAGTSVTGTSPVASFAHGGSFTVGGRSGIDSNLVQFKASRGERVDITPAGGAVGGSKVVVNVYAPPGSQVEQTRNSVGDTDQINIYIDNAVARSLRPGTATFRAMQATFGSRQQLVPR